MHFGQALYLFLVAILAGILKLRRRGGSFISFPVLLFIGMSPIAANATNTAAVWPGTVARGTFWRTGKGFNNREARALLVPLLITGVIGGVLGAVILLHTPQGQIPAARSLASPIRHSAFCARRANHRMEFSRETRGRTEKAHRGFLWRFGYLTARSC